MIRLAAAFDERRQFLPLIVLLSGTSVVLFFALHLLSQLVFKSKNEPPLVFSWVPILGSTIEYGIDPYKFFFKYRQKFGDVFTFTLLGTKHTVCLGPEGNDFILNGKLSEISAAEIYRDLTVATFGGGVCYDASPAKLMEQKKFMKYSLSPEKLQSYIPIFIQEVHNFLAKSKSFQGPKGVFDVVETIGVISIFTASRSLQGREVRESFDAGLADLYHDLDMSFIPINFFYPWLPLPVNRRRDAAQRKIVAVYKSIISARKEGKGVPEAHEDDMIWNLMRSEYKDGTSVPDHEIAHMMIGMLMAGQHTSSSIAAWILLRLATRPDIQEELYLEQERVLGPAHTLPTYQAIGQLTLHRAVVRETLRLHAPIHSIMRAVKRPLTIVSQRPGVSSSDTYSIPPSHVLISAPGVTAQSTEYFTNPSEWDPYRWKTLKDVDEGIHESAPNYGPLSKSPASYYLPFGAGRHRCVGEQFAFLQLCTITAVLVREFRFRNLPGKGLVPTDYESMFTRPVVPAFLEWHRRSGGQGLSVLEKN